MVTRRQLVEELWNGEERLLFAEGFDAAIVGVAEGWFPAEGGGVHQGRAVVYDFDKCIRILVRQGMTEEEADEYLSYNTVGAYVGEGTPVFMKKLE